MLGEAEATTQATPRDALDEAVEDVGRIYDQIYALVEEEKRLVAAGVDEPVLAGWVGAWSVADPDLLTAYGAARRRLGIIRHLVPELSAARVQVADAVEALAAQQGEANGQALGKEAAEDNNADNQVARR